jgi:endonuclease III related protein
VTSRVEGLYQELLAAYGMQGWWPSPNRAGRKGFNARGYHPGDYEHPRSPAGRFEVVLGAILTQNTAWTNAEKALAELRGAGIRLPADVRSCPQRRLARLVRPSGYYNQKARKLKAISALLSQRGALTPRGAPARAALLSQWGVGPETADSILLYAMHVPVFVVDAYTRRFLWRVGIIGGQEAYESVQAIFHDALPPRHALFNEYHALIVAHAKKHCRAAPVCRGCPVHSCHYRHSRGT